MKKYLKGLAAISLALVLGVTGVNAATQKKNISTSACDTVYTNYYFFLEANGVNYFGNSPLSYISNTATAEYRNNSYQTYFDSNNIGYGQVKVDRNSYTTRDGITSMSLNDYYQHYKNASMRNGAYTDGTNNYIVSHDWYKVGDTQSRGSINLSSYSSPELIGATLDADSTITLQSSVSYNYANPFQIRIERQYTGYLTGNPIPYGDTQLYLHPAVYYVQYCSPKSGSTVYFYTVSYDGNADDVTNVPSSERTSYGFGTEISTIRPERTGYRFLGWSLYPDATRPSTIYAPGNEYRGEEGSITLYAVWEKRDADSYVISYRANTNDVVSNLPADVTMNIDSDAYLSSNVPVRNGYTFLGWSTDANATTAEYASGALYQGKKDVILYAVWKKNGQAQQQPGLPSNPKTGIADYLLPFGGVIAASGAGLGILRKKKSFRQF